jgi:uncharacterized protein
MSEKQGIEIDYCPDCRGIWLDRGELEKLIERSSSASYGSHDMSESKDDDHFKHNDKHHSSNDFRYGRRKNFFSELFD